MSLAEIDEYGPDDPIPLAKAAKLLFRGALTKSALRTEHRKGNLEILRIANKDFVTKNGINRMKEKCLKKSDPQDSGSDQTPAHGSSKTERTVSPQSALKQMLAQRKKSSQNTSPPNTGRSAAVVQLR